MDLIIKSEAKIHLFKKNSILKRLFKLRNYKIFV